MDELFESLVALIPIALILALRIISAKKKNEKAAASDKDDRTAEIQKKIEAFTGIKANRDPSFFTDRPDAGAAKPVSEKHYRMHWEESAAEKMQAAAKAEHVVPVATVSNFKSVRESETWPPDSGTRGSAVSSASLPSEIDSTLAKASDKNTTVQTPALIRKVSSLHPLQQAFVFSEILGTPKGLE